MESFIPHKRVIIGPRDKWMTGQICQAIRKRDRLKNLFQTYGLFTWKEEDPSTRKILEGGITLRWVYMQKFRPVSCPSREG